MATAWIRQFNNMGWDGTNIILTVVVYAAGSDIPPIGGTDQFEVDVAFLPSATVGQIGSALASAIRTAATARGYSIAANGVIAPSYTKI